MDIPAYIWLKDDGGAHIKGAGQDVEYFNMLLENISLRYEKIA